MNPQLFETLESRTLMSVGTLAPGAARLFDFNVDGRNDAVLVNTGASEIEYGYTAGEGLDFVNLTADGGRFTTNTWVAQVGDTSADLDFAMGTTQLSMDVRYRNTRYGAIAGEVNVREGSVSQLEIGQGDLADLTTTQGDVGRVYVRDGDLANVTSAGAIDSLVVDGDIVGWVTAAGGINRISADRLAGAQIQAGVGGINQLAIRSIDGAALVQAERLGTLTAGTITGGSQISVFDSIAKLQAGSIFQASISAGGSIDTIVVDTITGSESGTDITVGRHVGTFQAQTVTAGVNGILSLNFNAGVDCLTIGLIDGGEAHDGLFAGTFLSVKGTVQRMSAGLISGGTSNGLGSFAMLNVSIEDLLGDDGSVAQAGDVVRLRASAFSGGVSNDGGDAMLNVTIAHDLVDASIGQMVGNGRVQPSKDPSIYLNVGHDIVKMVVSEISAGNAVGEYAYASVNITAGNDILSLTAGTVDAGSASGAGSQVAVRVSAGRDIHSITARSFSGGQATGTDALAGVYVEAARNIDFIGATLISGTQATIPIQDPTVQFIAGGDIGLVLAGRITGGTVTAAGDAVAQSSVLVQALGTYVDADGVQSEGNIGKIVAGTLDGGTASGATALSYVKISAAHDIDKLYADTISGGTARNDGFAYVSILAEHNINDLQAGVISGTTGGRVGCDPAVRIQAYNDIKSFIADRIIAGLGGDVSILAGIDADGNVSGDPGADGQVEGGSIERMVVGMISGNGGIVNIAAGGDIEALKVCQIVSGDGEVNIVAGGDVTADVRSIRSWSLAGESGVQFSAGGAVNDVRSAIRAEYTQEGIGQAVEFPEPTPLPE